MGLATLIGAAVTYIIIQVIAQLALLVTSGLLGLTSLLLGWVTSPGFIKVSFTTNDFVTLGLGITQGFANIIIVLALLAIGLGTALRIGGYEAKKALPVLILVALLINFIPLICGLIIDATNIVMDFFIGGGLSAGQVLVNQLKAQGQSFVTLWENIGSITELLGVGLLLRTVFLIIFNLMAMVIFLLFSVLFAMRYVALWILVIIAPLAFVFYILPATKKMFSTWWNQFLQWSIIGMTAAFFLYLGEQMIAFISQKSLLGPVPPGSELGGLESLVPHFIALGFLLFGFFASLSAGAWGTAGIIAFARSGVKSVQRGAAGKTWKGIKENAPRAVPEGVRRWGEKLSTILTPGAAQPGVAGAVKRAAAGPFWGIARAAGKTIGPGVEEARKGNIASAEAEAEKIVDPILSSSRLEQHLGANNIEGATGYVVKNINKGGPYKKSILKTLTLEGARKVAKSEEEKRALETRAFERARSLVKNSLEIGAVSQAETIARALRDKYTPEQLGFKKKEELSEEEKKKWEKKGWENQTQRLSAEADTPEKIKQFSENFWDSPEAAEAIQKFWGGKQLGIAAQEFGRGFTEAYSEALRKIPNVADHLLQTNPNVLLYLSGNAAQDLGFEAPEGLERKEIRERISKFRRREYTPEVIITPPPQNIVPPPPSLKSEEGKKKKEEDTKVVGPTS